MKLISLYIENFGGLSQYSLNFDDGLTVIQEENGFGKTTLAEFIRAMFYGFPRKSKTLDKSKRQKYMPWNGGKCGGNLVFEFEGQRYRMERTFGATPKGDSFKLLDLATNKKSDRFSEEIGLELFQLDADSFERSTYMPQLHDAGSLTTDSIQAKLGDLVEDTGDINNFDKAVAALKAKRIGYQLYRGTGGSVAEAQSQITRLQRELDAAEGKRAALEAGREEIRQLEQTLEEKTARIETIRGEITQASEARAVAAVRKQYGDLTDRIDAAAGEMARLSACYPNGLPGEAELTEAERTADQSLVLAGQEVTTPADQEALDHLAQNRSRFENQIPEQAQLDGFRAKCAEYRALQTQARSVGLSDGEKAQYEKIRPIFESGALDEDKLNGFAEQNRELVKKKHTLEALSMDAGDGALLEQLERRFGAGVPSEEELQAHRQALAEAETLRQENLRLAALREPVPQPKQANWTLPAVLAVVSVAGIAAGIVGLVKQSFLPGGLALGAGVAALVAAIFLGLRQMVSRELSGVQHGISPEHRRKIEENETRIAAAENAAGIFVGRYLSEGSLTERLQELKNSREDLIALREKRAALEEKRTLLAGEIAAAEDALRQGLRPYFGQVADFEKAIVNLQLVRSQFLDLRQEKAEADAKCAELTARAQALCAEVTEFLGGYYGQVSPERLEDLLAALQREADAYVRAEARSAQWQERKLRHQQELSQCGTWLDAFFARWGGARSGDARRDLRQMRSDREDLEALCARLETLKGERAAFEQTHARELAAPVPEVQPDLEGLKLRESGLAAEHTKLTWELLEARQHSAALQAQVDRIPQLRDELESWQEKRTADLKKAQTLDDTVDFLQKAKDSLSLSYLEPIRSSFTAYMEKLAGERAEQILISPDLEVQMERLGEARELAYFSAGQTDTVMLCMRLALVDALFREVKPFVILDDPFVNLDDRRTAEALALLRELAKDRQIIYLVCNSSRNF